MVMQGPPHFSGESKEQTLGAAPPARRRPVAEGDQERTAGEVQASCPNGLCLRAQLPAYLAWLP